MKNKRTIGLVILLLSFGLFFTASVAEADYRDQIAQQTYAFAGTEGANLGTPEDPRVIAGSLIQSMLGLIGMVTIAYVIYAGFLIMRSAGDEEMMKKGKSILRNAVIGVILILSAWGITRLVVLMVTGYSYRTGVNCRISQDEASFQNPDPLGQSISERMNPARAIINRACDVQ